MQHVHKMRFYTFLLKRFILCVANGLLDYTFQIRAYNLHVNVFIYYVYID